MDRELRRSETCLENNVSSKMLGGRDLLSPHYGTNF
nr:MAG TPA: hypothetical protein [Crassvirales sp.]